MRLQRNHYEILGVPRTASPQELKKKYHDLARQFHPDRARDKELAQRLFVQINQAYGILSNPEKRAIYDAGLIRETSAQSQPAQANGTRHETGQRFAAADQAPSQRPSPQQVEEIIAQASAAHMRGRLDTARQLVNQVLRYDPRNVRCTLLVGDICSDQGRKDEASIAYRTVLSLQPNHVMATERLRRLQAAPAANGNRTASAAPRNGASSASAGARDKANTATLPKPNFLQRLMSKVK